MVMALLFVHLPYLNLISVFQVKRELKKLAVIVKQWITVIVKEVEFILVANLN